MNSNQLCFLTKNPREIWALERHEIWFTNLWGRRDDDCPALQRQWKEDFRMSRKTLFESIP